jgi:hypothetical protein
VVVNSIVWRSGLQRCSVHISSTYTASLQPSPSSQLCLTVSHTHRSQCLSAYAKAQQLNPLSKAAAIAMSEVLITAGKAQEAVNWCVGNYLCVLCCVVSRCVVLHSILYFTVVKLTVYRVSPSQSNLAAAMLNTDR